MAAKIGAVTQSRQDFIPKRRVIGEFRRLLGPEQLAEFSKGADILILPDRIGAEDGGPEWVAFVAVAQELRVELEGRVHVYMARPKAASLRVYEEHDATVVLPILLPIASAAAAAIAREVIAEWIKRRFGGSPKQTVRYRRASANAVTGEIEVIEVEGPADAAERLIQVAEDESLPQG